jgi:hypothetical protein
VNTACDLTKPQKRHWQTEGYLARQAGQPLPACPAAANSDEEYHWQIGWWRHYYANVSATEVAADLAADAEKTKETK